MITPRTYTYIDWWHDNGGGQGGYTEADHTESHMRAIDQGALSRMSPLEAYDLLHARYGSLVASEAWQRWWRARAPTLE